MPTGLKQESYLKTFMRALRPRVYSAFSQVKNLYLLECLNIQTENKDKTMLKWLMENRWALYANIHISLFSKWAQLNKGASAHCLQREYTILPKIKYIPIRAYTMLEDATNSESNSYLLKLI